VVEEAIFAGHVADGRCVDEGDHFCDMFQHQTVEEDLIAILQAAQKEVFGQHILLSAEVAVAAVDLLFDGGDVIG